MVAFGNNHYRNSACTRQSFYVVYKVVVRLRPDVQQIQDGVDGISAAAIHPPSARLQNFKRNPEQPRTQKTIRILSHLCLRPYSRLLHNLRIAARYCRLF